MDTAVISKILLRATGDFVIKEQLELTLKKKTAYIRSAAVVMVMMKFDDGEF